MTHISQADGNDALAAKGAEPIVVDYNSPSSLQSAFKGVNIVISTLGNAALAAQMPLGDAAKAAGVKLFVPGEFGADTRRQTQGSYGEKNKQRERLKQNGLPWALFFTGTFADRIFYIP